MARCGRRSCPTSRGTTASNGGSTGSRSRSATSSASAPRLHALPRRHLPCACLDLRAGRGRSSPWRSSRSGWSARSGATGPGAFRRACSRWAADRHEISINNSIVLVTSIDEHAERRALAPAVMDAACGRLRPIPAHLAHHYHRPRSAPLRAQPAGGVPEPDRGDAGRLPPRPRRAARAPDRAGARRRAARRRCPGPAGRSWVGRAARGSRRRPRSRRGGAGSCGGRPRRRPRGGRGTDRARGRRRQGGGMSQEPG
jgi:hypothetical protein